VLAHNIYHLLNTTCSLLAKPPAWQVSDYLAFAVFIHIAGSIGCY